ncbi:MAG: hypothetical protein ACRBBN_11525, partial [Methyloligellaceae bacterium]
MTVETTRLSREYSGIFFRKAAKVGAAALLTVLLAFSPKTTPAYATKNNVWLAQVKPIDADTKTFKIANLNGPSGQQLKL